MSNEINLFSEQVFINLMNDLKPFFFIEKKKHPNKMKYQMFKTTVQKKIFKLSFSDFFFLKKLLVCCILHLSVQTYPPPPSLYRLLPIYQSKNFSLSIHQLLQIPCLLRQRNFMISCDSSKSSGISCSIDWMEI